MNLYKMLPWINFTAKIFFTFWTVIRVTKPNVHSVENAWCKKVDEETHTKVQLISCQRHVYKGMAKEISEEPPDDIKDALKGE